mmetsp:Transcript_33868/g.53859  ORF Transcript_33868/g.53859 Transcript_33868/m.53859 type:complete len:201 (-) Transcript_33868:6-608(-)
MLKSFGCTDGPQKSVVVYKRLWVNNTLPKVVSHRLRKIVAHIERSRCQQRWNRRLLIIKLGVVSIHAGQAALRVKVIIWQTMWEKLASIDFLCLWNFKSESMPKRTRVRCCCCNAKATNVFRRKACRPAHAKKIKLTDTESRQLWRLSFALVRDLPDDDLGEVRAVFPQRHEASWTVWFCLKQIDGTVCNRHRLSCNIIS